MGSVPFPGLRADVIRAEAWAQCIAWLEKR